MVLFGCQHSRITNRIVITMKGAKWRFGFCALRLANFSFKSASPMTEAIPPTAPAQRKSSVPTLMVASKLKSDGGVQYWGRNIMLVRANGAETTVPQIIRGR